MKAKKIKVEVLLAAAFVLICTGLVGMWVRPALEPDKVLRARFGDVPWNHEQHARMAEISNCTVCHHTEQQGVTRPRPCSECHKRPDNMGAMVLSDLYAEPAQVKYGGDQGPPAMQAFHAKCLGCHKAMDLGPMVCRDCHVQNFSGLHGQVTWDHFVHSRKMDVDCVSCHHQDSEVTSEGGYRPCQACHQPARILNQPLPTGIEKHEDFAHGECIRCHVEYNPEHDDRSCAECHPGWAVDTKKQAPCLEEALHLRCMECHSMSHPDYTQAMPVYCTDCHKPDPSWLTNLGTPDSGQGSVLWNHNRHAKFGDMGCRDCHHTYVEGEPVIACRQCHDGGHIKGIPPAAKVIETNCVKCHKDKDAGHTTWAGMKTDKPDLGLILYEGKDTPSFWWDHRTHAVAYGFACRECHHNTYRKNGKFVTAERVNKTWPAEAGQLQSCTACHGPNGPVAGSVASGTKAPALEEAYKRSCLGCHQRLGGGPQTWSEIHGSNNHGKK